MWSGGVVINLGTFLSSIATAINNRGQIIGFNSDASLSSPFLWDNGVMSELPGLTSVSDINDRGQILGLSDGRPVIWTHGMMTSLALPPGAWQVTTASINELGHAVGTITSTAPGAVSMAVLWRDGTVITLPGLAANELTVALDLNDRDEIVGWSGAPRRASLWVPQTPPTTTNFTGLTAGEPLTQAAHPVPIDLGTLGGTYSTPAGINDDGVVVGSSTTAAREQHAFVWTPTNGMVDLGTLGGTSLATAVNNSAQVVGASYVRLTSPTGYRPFLWTFSAGMEDLGTLTECCEAQLRDGDERRGTGRRHKQPPRRVMDTDRWIGGPRHARWSVRAAGGGQHRRPGRRHQQPRNRPLPPSIRSCGRRAAACWTWARWAGRRVRPRP